MGQLEEELLGEYDPDRRTTVPWDLRTMIRSTAIRQRELSRPSVTRQNASLPNQETIFRPQSANNVETEAIMRNPI
jgi:hypothetical protein